MSRKPRDFIFDAFHDHGNRAAPPAKQWTGWMRAAAPSILSSRISGPYGRANFVLLCASQPWIEGIPQTVAQEVEGEHCDGQCQGGKDRLVWVRAYHR